MLTRRTRCYDKMTSETARRTSASVKPVNRTIRKETFLELGGRGSCRAATGRNGTGDSSPHAATIGAGMDDT